MTPQTPTWTCIADACGYALPWWDWDEATSAMQRHVITKPHDGRWPVTFRLDYGPGREHGVHYEQAVMTHLGDQRATDRTHTKAQCKSGREIDTGQAPTFVHTDDGSECEHGVARTDA